MTKFQPPTQRRFYLVFLLVILTAASILITPLNLKALEKTPYRKPYSDLKQVISKDDLANAGLSISYETVVCQGTLFVIGGEDREGVISTQNLRQWTEDFNGDQLNLIGHAAVAFKDRIWVIGGSGPNGFTNNVWSSSDGKGWRKAKNPPFAPRADHAMVVFQDKLWVLGGSGKELESYSDVWCSADGENWERVTDNAGFGRRDRHAAVAVDGKLFVIGGNLYNSSEDFSPQAWASPDGKDWRLVSKDIGCRPIDGTIKATVSANRIWLAAWGASGLSLWHSFKGRFWEEIRPKAVIEDDCTALVHFRKDIYVFTPIGIFIVE